MEAIVTQENSCNWIPILNLKNNPEADWHCPKCNKAVVLHPNYAKLGASGCAGKGKCFTVEESCRQLVAARKWTFKSCDKIVAKNTINFICSNGHESSLMFGALRKGSNCKGCTKKIPKEKIKIENRRPMCQCVLVKNGHASPCMHYNHKLDIYGGAEEWDYFLNFPLRPEQVNPSTAKKFWYKCSNEWCQMTYQQSPNSRQGKSRCKYCMGYSVCEWNCLLTNYPDLCQELHPDNYHRAKEVRPGSPVKLIWICYRHDTPYIYEATVHNRVKNKSGCSRCVKGGDQSFFGHSHFVKESISIHGNIYIYNEEYSGAKTPINVFCPVYSYLNGEISQHGNFKVTPDAHKRRQQGCPLCSSVNTQSKLIKELQKILDLLGYRLGIECFSEVTFDGLVYKNSLRVDRYIIKENLIIEADGAYHFFDKDRGNDELLNGQIRDLIKDRYCLERGINLIRIPYNLDLNIRTLKCLIDLCRSGKRVYASYNHYYLKMAAVFDMSNITCINMPIPPKTVVLI